RDAVLFDEARQFGDALIDVADDPCLRNARPGAIPRAVLTALGEELVVNLTAIPLGGTHWRPVALGIVGDEARPDDTDTPRIGVTPGGFHGVAPGVENLRALALRQEVRVETRRA